MSRDIPRDTSFESFEKGETLFENIMPCVKSPLTTHHPGAPLAQTLPILHAFHYTSVVALWPKPYNRRSFHLLAKRTEEGESWQTCSSDKLQLSKPEKSMELSEKKPLLNLCPHFPGVCSQAPLHSCPAGHLPFSASLTSTPQVIYKAGTPIFRDYFPHFCFCHDHIHY